MHCLEDKMFTQYKEFLLNFTVKTKAQNLHCKYLANIFLNSADLILNNSLHPTCLQFSIEFVKNSFKFKVQIFIIIIIIIFITLLGKNQMVLLLFFDQNYPLNHFKPMGFMGLYVAVYGMWAKI